MLVIGSVFQCCSTVVSLFLNYECTVYKEPSEFVASQDNPSLAPILETCLGEKQQVSSDLGIESEVTALSGLFV